MKRLFLTVAQITGSTSSDGYLPPAIMAMVANRSYRNDTPFISFTASMLSLSTVRGLLIPKSSPYIKVCRINAQKE